MRKILFTYLIVLYSIFGFVQIVNIPDENFKATLIEEGVDTNGDGEIQESEAETVTFLDVSNEYMSSDGIENLTGIEAFTNLEFLDCSWKNLTTLDVCNKTFEIFKLMLK